MRGASSGVMSRAGPEAGLILINAGTAARREAARELATELARAADWELVSAKLDARRLMPALGERMLNLCPSRARSRFATAVERSIVQTRRQGALVGLVSSHLTQALTQAGIRSLILKGAFLAEAIYRDPGRRATSDIDLLVAPGDLPGAVEVVRRTGYGTPKDPVGSEGLPVLHYALTHDSGRLPALDLHWRVHWYERAFAADMLARATEDDRFGLRATPLDELAALLLFYARDGFLDLRLAIDLATWWDLLGAGLQAGALAEVIDRYPDLSRALLAAAGVAEQIVGVPAERLLGGEHRADLRTRLATRLANPDGRGDPAQLNAEVGMVDWLLAPRGGQREFIRRQLLPPRRVLEERSRMGERPTVSPLGHGVRVLARYGLTMARMAASTRARPASRRLA